MSRQYNRVGPPPDIRVLIRDAAGLYLAGDPHQWFFTPDRAAAAVFSYDADHVREQLESIRKTHGLILRADPVPLEEIYESCDCCRELFIPFMVFFDGHRFLCPDCRKRAGRTIRREKPAG